MGMIDVILQELEREAATTRRVLERVPDGQLAFRPHPKSMNLGQLAFHLAGLPRAITNLALVPVFEAKGFSQAEAKSLQQILDEHDAGLAFARETLATFSDAFLFETWSLAQDGVVAMSVPRIGLLRSVLLNHSYHHRGQLSVYLRLLDVPVPSIYGPSADESPFG